ncbi:MAG: hypothetical protein QHC67_17715 [Sphingobium sp.]|uniref:hypothetical protein n=1 Tax=Sphingobium sp. TaxID=1912891 RepID=UPI0029AA0820|nr:hypothetical protein [Sphingobium sp.]MDX3911625.1 hypothetical protein [Sphingobium sp.]
MKDQDGDKIARRALLALFATGAGMLIAGCGLVKSYAPFRYRLTVEIATPQGLRTGSCVIEVTAGEVGTTLGGASAEARGEAVAVDIAPGQTLFVLLRSDASYGWAAGIMSGVTPKANDLSIPREERFRARIDAVRANHKLNVVPRWFAPRNDVDAPVTGYPIMVRFRDTRDPKTVELVDPDNLAISFGPGVTLRRITVQLTDDPVTTGIDKRLGWLPHHRGQLVSATKDDPENVRKLSNVTEGDFSMGIFQ